MPYIITTRFDGAVHPQVSEPGRPNPVAVATLDDARDYVTGLFPFPQFGFKIGERIGSDLSAMRETGGTIGPLPDGTVIEVRYRDHAVMCPQAEHRADRSGACTCPELIADADRKALEFARNTPPWSKRAAGINFRA